VDQVECAAWIYACFAGERSLAGSAAATGARQTSRSRCRRRKSWTCMLS